MRRLVIVAVAVLAACGPKKIATVDPAIAARETLEKANANVRAGCFDAGRRNGQVGRSRGRGSRHLPRSALFDMIDNRFRQPKLAATFQRLAQTNRRHRMGD